MNNVTKAIAIAITLLMPVSFAFADEHEDLGLQVGGIGVGAHADDDIKAAIDSHMDVNAEASSSVSAGYRDHDADADKDASSTSNGGWKRAEEHAEASTTVMMHGIKGGLSSFFNWFFSLPASTTIGEVRADLQASTSASSTVPGNAGLGFWARFWSFFRF